MVREQTMDVMIPTPRTDALMRKLKGSPAQQKNIILSEHARQLERELCRTSPVFARLEKGASVC